MDDPKPNITPEMQEKFIAHTGDIKVKVRTKGLRKTKFSVIEQDIRAIEKEKTTLGVLQALEAAKERWRGLDCFTDISVDGFAPAAEGGGNLFADIRFTEGGSMSLGVFTDAQRVAPEFKYSQKNILGLAYNADIDVTLNAHQYLFRSGVKSHTSTFGSSTEYFASREKITHTRNSATDEWLLGGGTQVFLKPFKLLGTAVSHSFSINSSQRKLVLQSDVNEQRVDDDLRSSLGDSQQNSIRYEFGYDRRKYNSDSGYNHPLGGFAVWGNMLASGKYIGLGASGNHVSQLRGELKGHFVTSLPTPIPLIFNWNWKVGTQHCLDKLRSNDRFYIETDLVRGFMRVGEQYSNGGLKGGDTMCASSLQVCCPLPIPGLPRGAFSGHAFYDIGLIGERAKAALSSSSSVGVGVHVTAFPMLGNMGRMEFNFSHPLSETTKADHKRWKFGMQWLM